MSRLVAGLFLTAFAGLAAGIRAQDPPERAPSTEVEPHTVHRFQSEAGLRYTWTIPPGYDGNTDVGLTIILHGTGLDYRWGHWNNKPATFRPQDVVVSVDGTSPGPNDSRLFLGEKKDAEAFHAFLIEMRERFAVDRVFLYGHSQGGFFVVYFAGEFPDDVDGVCAHASGAWNWSKTGKELRKVAIAYMHGTRDPVVPYRQSVGSRDAYLKAGLPLVHLRRLAFYNHWPNGVRADEELAWCEGMTTGDPARALELATRILTPKPADEYQWTTVVGFGAAREVLRRIETGEPRAFDSEVDGKTLGAARKLITRLESHGREHVAALRKQVPSKKALAFAADAEWLGHLVALREDFRGVESVEEYVEGLGFDKLLAQQEKGVQKILEAWYGDDELEACRVTLAGLPKAFLFEGYPAEFAEKITTWRARAKQWKLSRKELAALELVEAWDACWKKGAEAYRKIWKDWD